jgi:SAM-dependent methyltransferase
MSVSNMSNVRQETDEWHEWYGDAAEIQRRLQNMPEKLARFGLREADRRARILDMCCGHGEALQVLKDWGFSDIEGFDQRIHEPLRSSSVKTHEGDAHKTGLPSQHFDWILNIHSMHHLGSVEDLRLWIEEMRRLLKPGGRFAIVDFRPTWQLHLAFWLFRRDWFHATRYLRHFGKQVQDEWDQMLEPYLRNWAKIRELLWSNGFQVERESSDLWYFYLTLRKSHS